MASGYGNDRTYLLGKPTFTKLSNGRLRCVETAHEISARDVESYSKGKRCRLELINSAVAKKKPPFNMFAQDPDSRSNLICKLTGDSISKSEEQIWKHMNGRRFLDKLEEQQKAKRRANDRFEDSPASKKLKKKSNNNNKKGKGKEKIIDDSDSEAIETSKKKRKLGLEFWFPPKGNRWGFDGGDHSASASEPGSESEENEAEEEEEEEVEEGSDDSWSSEEILTKKKRKFVADTSSSRKKKNNINDSARGSQEEDRDQRSKGFTFPGQDLFDDHDEPLELPSLPFLIPGDSEDNKDMNHGVQDGDMNVGVHDGDLNDETHNTEMNDETHNIDMNDEIHNTDMNDEIPVPNNPSSKVPVAVSCGSFNSQAVVRDITHIIKENFMGPYISWKLIPLDIRKFYWRKFQEKFLVKEENYHEIKKVWDLTSHKRYVSILGGARREALKKTGKKSISQTKGKGPSWMKPAIWNAIVDKWNTPQWKERSKCARRNRMTIKDGSITKHSGGAITFAEHKLRLAKELGREPTQAELFQRVHKGKGSDFIDNKSKRVMEAYQAALVEKYGEEDAGKVVFDEEAWTKAVGKPKKGRVGYGLPHPDLHKVNGASSSSLHPRSEGPSGSNQISAEQVMEVLQVNEELRGKIEEQKAEMEQQRMQMEERMEQQQSQIEMMHSKMVALIAELDGRRVLRPR